MRLQSYSEGYGLFMGYVGGNIGGFPVLAIDLCPKGGALAHFQSQGDSKKHTNIATNNSYSEVPHGRGISENKGL